MFQNQNFCEERDGVYYYTPPCYGNIQIPHSTYEAACEVKKFHQHCERCKELKKSKTNLKRKN